MYSLKSVNTKQIGGSPPVNPRIDLSTFTYSQQLLLFPTASSADQKGADLCFGISNCERAFGPSLISLVFPVFGLRNLGIVLTL
jgi:hypothetical protein